MSCLTLKQYGIQQNQYEKNFRLVTKDIILVKDTPNHFKDSNTKMKICLTTNTTIKSDTQMTHKDSSIAMVIKS